MRNVTKTELYHRLRTIAIIHLILIVIAGVLLFLAKHGIGIPCLFYTITGFQCPGCGNSRAIVSLLHLDILTAFRYNPLFLLEFAYIGFVCCSSTYRYIKTGTFSYRSPSTVMDCIILILIVLWGIIRNII